jgi:hypothetical protein
MGVQNFWQLIDSTGRPVNMNKGLEGKVLAIGKTIPNISMNFYYSRKQILVFGFIKQRKACEIDKIHIYFYCYIVFVNYCILKLNQFLYLMVEYQN